MSDDELSEFDEELS